MPIRRESEGLSFDNPMYESTKPEGSIGFRDIGSPHGDTIEEYDLLPYNNSRRRPRLRNIIIVTVTVVILLVIVIALAAYFATRTKETVITHETSTPSIIATSQTTEAVTQTTKAVTAEMLRGRFHIVGGEFSTYIPAYSQSDSMERVKLDNALRFTITQILTRAHIYYAFNSVRIVNASSGSLVLDFRLEFSVPIRISSGRGVTVDPIRPGSSLPFDVIETAFKNAIISSGSGSEGRLGRFTIDRNTFQLKPEYLGKTPWPEIPTTSGTSTTTASTPSPITSTPQTPKKKKVPTATLR